jgi:hypothetical protein
MTPGIRHEEAMSALQKATAQFILLFITTLK